MKYSTNVHIVSVFTLGLLLLAGSFSAKAARAFEPSDQPGVKRALLIGINKYKAVPKLHGSLNDVETMRHVLLTRWGFSEKHITVVTDEGGTRAGILAALDQLVKEAGPNDTVYFHYSGHGSQVEDISGDEVDDHLDETLVPQDGRSGNIPDITDDELDAMFATMRAKNALIVLDSCHSGTATRSLDIQTRSIPRDTRLDLYRKAEEEKPATRAIVPVMTSRYVVMTGAASHQEALDGPVEGRYHGFFTYALSKSLSHAGPGASPREIFFGVERELKRIQTHFGRNAMPEPQLEAPPHLVETALLGTVASSGAKASGESMTRLAWVEVLPAQSEMVTLVNGMLLGAGPGSTWSIYPAGETRFAPGKALGVATVTQVNGKDAHARVQSSASKIPSGARAVALLPAPTGRRIPIRVLDIPRDRRELVEEMLKKSVPDVDLVGSDQSARFAVDIKGDKFQLLTADGLGVVASFGLNEGWGAGVAAVVSRSANASELLALDNPSSHLRIDLRVASASKRKPTVSTRGIKVVADTQAAKYVIRKPGKPRSEQNSLQLEVKVNADSYITIVDVDSEGGVNLLFPNNYQKPTFHGDGFVRANESLLVPDSLKPGNKAGFYWDYSPPKGTDTVRVFTSTDLPTAQMIRDRITSLQTSAEKPSATVNRRSVATGMDLLRQQLASVAARGILTVADDTSHIPGSIVGSPSPTASLIDVTGAPAGPATPQDPTASGMPATTDPAPDWAGASVTIAISD